MQQPGRILLVEAQQNFREALSETLRARGYQVTSVENGTEALEAFEEEPSALVIAGAEGIDEAEFMRRISACDPAAQVILTLNSPSAHAAFEAMRSGAFDCLFKPFGNLDLVAEVAERAFERRWAVTADRRRIGDLERRNERLERANRMFRELGRRDALTGLFDAVHFRERLIAETARTLRTGAGFTVAVLDLDGLAGVNRLQGRSAGDALLVEAAGVLRARLRKSDLAARHRTRDFVLLLPETPLPGAAVLAEDLRERIRVRSLTALENAPAGGATVSIGVAEFAGAAAEAEAVLREAEKALGNAKEAGRDRVCLSASPARPGH